MARRVRHEQVREPVDDVDRLALASHPDGQALRRELVDDVEHAELTPVMGAILDEVVRPDMAGILRPQPDAGSVIEPEPSSLRLLLWHFQPLPPPDPLDPLRVHQPAGVSQQGCDAPVAIAAILGSQCDDVGGQRRFIFRLLEDLALCGAMLAQNPAGQPLGDTILGDHVIHTGATAGRAYQFPEAASFRISFSRVRSETARRNRAFSVSNSFSRLT